MPAAIATCWRSAAPTSRARPASRRQRRKRRNPQLQRNRRRRRSALTFKDKHALETLPKTEMPRLHDESDRLNTSWLTSGSMPATPSVRPESPRPWRLPGQPWTTPRTAGHPRHLVERRAIRHTRARCRPGDPVCALALGLGAERHDQIDTGPERRRQHPPVVLRPFLVGPGGGVQQHSVRFGGRLGQSRAVEAEVRRTVRRIAQRQAGQGAVSRNGVLIPLNRMGHIIERAGEHILDAVGIVAVAAASRGARNQRRFEEQPLRIDDLVIGARPQRPQEIPDLLPCLGLPRRLPPPS